MRNLLLVAKREYLEQVRGRAFKLTTFGLPAIFAVIIAIGYFSSLGIGSGRHLAIASDDPALAQLLRSRILGQKDSKATVDVIAPATPADRQQLVDKLRAKSLDGVLWVEDSASAQPKATYMAPSAGDFLMNARLESALNKALVDEHLIKGGMQRDQAAAISKGIDLATYQVKPDGAVIKSNAEASFWKGYVMAILLSMTTMIYGMNVARSIIQEKTSRIFEVMLAIAKPSDLLGGKLVGVCAVGLTQIAIWLIATAVFFATPLSASVMSGQLSIHISAIEAILFPVYFMLGYLLFSSLFAGLAATCETEQELQMYMPLAAAPTWLSFALIVLVMNDSNSVWSVAASLFPPTAPVIMFLRMASETPPAWQFAVSIGLLALSIVAVLWFSTKLYRVGILMYGKRATLPEIFRWIRYS
ncbi:MAG: ABC transporter permease [Acidobacteriota bacterium]|nr:ABC transporter permease [Acidobacteriota bacterium]